MPTYLRYEHDGGSGHGELADGLIHPLDGDFGAWRRSGAPPLRLADVRLLAPTMPSKIVAVGPNFGIFFANGGTPPDRPMFWVQPPSAVNHHDGVIELPPGVPAVNHEVELAIVIGKTAKCVSVADAAAHILGYTCMNDVTAGDFAIEGAFPASPYFVYGKIYDGFAPLGPWIVTDLDTRALHLETRVNGTVRQSHSTADFLFQPAQLVSWVSEIVMLAPGDVISTGSPPGVMPIVDGDVVEIEIAGIGTLRNHARDRP